ncbi:MAG: type I-E CRISPR-associated endonuclease Cas1 [Armatimonadetes bacterium]|nr:type I-E CRISPR-associated endonuclease Cas1 [Armatimonadota bacterium]
MDNLRSLPKFRDGLSYLYLEHCRIDQCDKSVSFHDKDGETPVPAASVAVLMLGPGTSITQAAIRALADNNTLVIWCGEENVRFYAWGTGGTRSARAILEQARLASDDQLRLQVVHRMYRMRFDERLDADMDIQQLRGKEGMRVRAAYRRASAESGVPWSGRNYDRGSWSAADPVNRALSAANSCLYGLCHAAILSSGFSPALGFIHTGKQLSFVYDIADLYKAEITIPVAFQAAKDGPADIERRVRLACRDLFRETQLLKRIIPDIFAALGLRELADEEDPYAEDAAKPADLWDPTGGDGEGLSDRLI